jgi:glutamine amidotransferase
MGWNTLRLVNDHPLFDGIALGDDGWHAYFLHGFHLVTEEAHDVAAVADYGGPVTAVVARGTIAGTQFHPEKSQKLGLRLLGNFLQWRP